MSLATTILTSVNVGVESYMLQWCECIVRRHLTAGRGRIIACMRFRKLRCTKVYMVMLGFSGWGLQVRLTLTVNCTLQSCLFETWALQIVSLWTSLLMDIGWHNVISDMSSGGPNIQLVGIKLSLHSKHWELRPVWVSVVRGWAGDAGHRAESLNEICLLPFSLWSFRSFNRYWTCRSNFMISRNRSKHTTLSISS